MSVVRHLTIDALTGSTTVEEVDPAAGRIRWIVDGKVESERTMTLDDHQRIAPPPLPPEATLAVLLAAKGVITDDEAAQVAGVTVEHVRHEARAWAVAAQLDTLRPVHGRLDTLD